MSNPFTKLKVQRDEDEEFVSVVSNKPQQPLFGNVQKDDKAKKPKQRPQEKKEVKEEDNNEGFEYVGKPQKKTVRTEVSGEIAATLEKKPGHKEFRDYHPKRTEGKIRDPGEKRVFDRHSGTGRGKEEKKHGAGKGNWGNPVDSAKRGIVDYDDTEYYFRKALNPVKEEVVTEDKATAEVAQEVIKEEIKPDEGEKTEKEYKERKGKGKPGLTEEEKEKIRLHIPENAITLAELKQQKQSKKEEPKPEVKVVVDLEPIENKKFTNEVGGKKKTQQKKDKKQTPNNDIQLLNLKIEDNVKTYDDRRKNEKKSNFKFNAKDFPEL
jgi:hypothetical protein